MLTIFIHLLVIFLFFYMYSPKYQGEKVGRDRGFKIVLVIALGPDAQIR